MNNTAVVKPETKATNTKPVLPPERLVESLLALPDKASQYHFLNTHLPHLPDTDKDEVADLLKVKADRLMRSDIEACLNTADLLFHLARLTDNEWHSALALRAKANAFGHGGLGEYQQAIKLYDEAADIYRRYDHIVYQAGTQYAKINPLIALGRYEEAFRIGEWAARVFEENEAWLLLAKLYVNLGAAYLRVGEDMRALKLYDKARVLYADLDSDEARLALARVELNRSPVLCNLGRFEESIAASQQAMAMLAASDQAAGVARAKQSTALTSFVLGRYNEALALLDEVRTTFFEDNRRRDAILVDLFISDCLLQLRRFAQVLEKAEETAALFAELGTQFEVGQSILNQAIAYAGLNRHEDALATLTQARRCFVQEGNQIWVASTDLETAVVLLRQGETNQSYETAVICAAVFADHNLPVEQAQAYLVAARAALTRHRLDAAQRHVREALAVTQEQMLPTLTYQAQHLLGQIALEQGRYKPAREAYDQAIDALETLRGRMMVEFRADFLEDKQVIYEDMVDLCLELDEPDAGLLYAERAKSRALLDLLAFQLNVGIQARDEGDEELVAELNRLRAERDRLYRRWAGNEATNERGSLSIDSGQQVAQQQVAGIEKQMTELWHKLLIRNADYARDAALCRVHVEPAQPHLDEHTALLEYYVSHGEVVVFVVTGEKVQVNRLGVKLPQVQQLLQLFWLNLRAVPRSDNSQLPRLAQNARGILQKIYGLLLEPVYSHLAAYPHLIIVPHGPLHYLPFHALYGDDAPLLAQKEISYLPSASFLRYCQEADRSGQACLVIGHSYQGSLPHTVAEARAIANLLSGRALVEEEATLAALQTAAADGRILHLATHGDFRPDNPIFSGLALADGWLTTLDIFNLRLHASLVTLSACQTGRSVIGGGDELLGLMRAFLSAGAASLVLSLWAVEDRSTASLMQAFYQNLTGGMTKGDALRRAQQQLMASDADYAHPYYWAPFYLVGDAGPL